MQNVEPLLEKFKTLSTQFIGELEAVVKGNKAAGARARKLDLKEIRPLLKEIKDATLGKE